MSVMTVMSLQVDHVSMAENGSQLTDRSQMVRDRLHRKKLIPFARFEATLKRAYSLSC